MPMSSMISSCSGPNPRSLLKSARARLCGGDYLKPGCEAVTLPTTRSPDRDAAVATS